MFFFFCSESKDDYLADKKSSKQDTELSALPFRSSIIPTSVSGPYDINRPRCFLSTRITWRAFAAR